MRTALQLCLFAAWVGSIYLVSAHENELEMLGVIVLCLFSLVGFDEAFAKLDDFRAGHQRRE